MVERWMLLSFSGGLFGLASLDYHALSIRTVPLVAVCLAACCCNSWCRAQPIMVRAHSFPARIV